MTIHGIFGEEIEVSTTIRVRAVTAVVLDVSEGDELISVWLSLDEATALRDALNALLVAEQAEMEVRAARVQGAEGLRVDGDMATDRGKLHRHRHARRGERRG